MRAIGPSIWFPSTLRESNLSLVDSLHVSLANFGKFTRKHLKPVLNKTLSKVKLFILMSLDLFQLLLTVIGVSALSRLYALAKRTLRVFDGKNVALQFKAYFASPMIKNTF